MEYVTFTELLRKRIAEMTINDQLRFAIVVCKRLYPRYAGFSDKHDWGDPELLLDAILACEHALDRRKDIQLVTSLRSRIEDITPDTDDFGDYDGSYALNASNAVGHTLQFVLDGSAENILNAAICYYDTVDLIVNGSNVLEDAAIKRHPLIKEARQFLLGQ